MGRTARFTFSCADLTSTFTDGSSDPDGTIASRSWTFGDNATGTGATVTHSYAQGGTYQVGLTVTDNGGLTSSTSSAVTVTAPQPTITLKATGAKLKRGSQQVTLEWSGASTAQVVITRRGTSSATITRPNTTGALNSYVDDLGQKGGGTYHYKVCETGVSSPLCSAEQTVVF